MGGGASKSNNDSSDTASTSTKERTATNTTTASPKSSPSNKAGEPVKPKLVCTVEDAKLNVFVPFVSSVQAGKKGENDSKEDDEEDDDLSDTDPSDLASDPVDGSRVVFGEVCIDLAPAGLNNSGDCAPTGTVGSPAITGRSSSPLLMKPPVSPPRSRSPGGDIFERPTYVPTYKIHGISLPPNPWKNLPESTKKPLQEFGPHAMGKNQSLLMGDLPVQGDPKTDTLSSWFSTPTRYAVPTKYDFHAFCAQSGPIRCLSASAEANDVAVVISGGKQCHLIDTTGTLLMSVKGHLDPVLSCAQSKDGKFLVTTSADCTAVMWDLNNGKKLRELPVSTQVSAVAVSDESDAIATTSTDDVVHLWDSKTCDPLIMFQRHSAGIFSIGFSRRGNLVASGSSNGEIYVWAQHNGEVKAYLAKHKTPVLAVSFSHDGQRLASVDRETLRVWDLFTGQCVYCRDTKGNVVFGIDEDQGQMLGRGVSDENPPRFTCCAFVAGHLIATAITSKQFLLIDPNEGKELLMIPTRALVTSLSLSWMGDVIFLGDFAGNIYRLELKFSPRDVAAFHLDDKPPSMKEKKGMEKD